MADDDSKCICRYTLEEIKSMPPLGLRPVATESFCSLVESTLSKSSNNVGSQNDKDKMKASNFPISTFTIGNWKRESTRKGNLTAKIYYGKKKLVWEFLNGPLKSKMEVCWSDITAIEAVMNPNQPGCLRIELAKPPLFFRKISPQPRKHSNWEPADDFTNGQAQFCKRHEATFPPGVLDKHYEKLLLSDERLAELSRRLFPTHESFFPLQQNPQQQQLHHSLNANIISASASSNGVMATRGNQINNDPTVVGSSSKNTLVVRDQRLHQYNYMAANNEPTFVGSSSKNIHAVRDQRLHQYNGMVLNNEPTFVGSSNKRSLVVNNEPTFVGSSSKNPLNVRDKKLYQHNYMANNNEPTTFVGSSSQNPIVVSDKDNDMSVKNEPTFGGSSSQNPSVIPASTIFSGSSSRQNLSVVPHQQLYKHNDTAAPFIPPPSSCSPKFQHGLIEVQYSDAGEQALADAILWEANATFDAYACSLIELFIVQGQEDHSNEPVGGGNVNEASSISPAPPSKP